MNDKATTHSRGAPLIVRMIVLCLVVTWAAGCQPTDAPDLDAEGPVPFMIEGLARAVASRSPDSEPGSGVLVVLIDALRPDRLGVYGSDRGLTPNIDRFAERSHVFEAAYGTSAWTRSSVASIFTSRYPTSHTVLDRDAALPEWPTTLAEALGRGGHWSFGITTNANAGEAIGFDRGFDRFGPPEGARKRGYAGEEMQLISAESVTEQGLRSIQAHLRERPGQPFFGFLHYIDPHDPYVPNPLGEIGEEPPGRYSGSRADLLALRGVRPEQLRPEDTARIEYLYNGEVAFTDYWIGRLLDGLAELGVLDELTVILTADHGESFWEHRVRGHGQTLYEPQIHVPLLVKLPGMEVDDRSRINDPVSLVDIAPTVLGIQNLPREAGFQGASLLPLMAGESRPSPLGHIFAELHLREDNRLLALRVDDHKLIKLVAGPSGDRPRYELYDLAADPMESHNLVDDPESRERLSRLQNALVQWEAAVEAWSGPGSRKGLDELDPETLENLRALGYIR